MKTLVASLFLLATPLAAQSVTTVTPVFDQLVAYDLPAGFAPVFEDGNATGYIHESVPPGESVQDWSQMITLTGAAGAGSMTAEAVAQSIAANYAAACPDSLSAVALGEVAVPGAAQAQAVYLGCGTVAGAERSEQMVMLIAIGSSDAYTLQWAERSPALAGPPAFDPALWGPRVDTLAAGFHLCDPVPGDSPPYHSCTD